MQNLRVKQTPANCKKYEELNCKETKDQKRNDRINCLVAVENERTENNGINII